MSMPYKNGMTPISPTNRSNKKKKSPPAATTTEAPFDRVRYSQVGSAMASNEAMWGSTSSGGAPACAFPTVPRVARSHAWDWAALLLLVAVDALLNIVEPFHRFVGAGMMADLRYPMKSNTVPVWAVPVRQRRTISLSLISSHFRRWDASILKNTHDILGGDGA